MGTGVSTKVQPILTIMDTMKSEPRAELQAAIDRVGECTLNVRVAPPSPPRARAGAVAPARARLRASAPAAGFSSPAGALFVRAVSDRGTRCALLRGNRRWTMSRARCRSPWTTSHRSSSTKRHVARACALVARPFRPPPRRSATDRCAWRLSPCRAAGAARTGGQAVRRAPDSALGCQGGERRARARAPRGDRVDPRT